MNMSTSPDQNVPFNVLYARECPYVISSGYIKLNTNRRMCFANILFCYLIHTLFKNIYPHGSCNYHFEVIFIQMTLCTPELVQTHKILVGTEPDYRKGIQSRYSTTVP